MSESSRERWLPSRPETQANRPLRRPRRIVDAVSSTECLVDGRHCLSFASNDYLGLAHHPEVVRALSAGATARAGAAASPLIAGRSPQAAELEMQLARFEHAEACLLFPTGFAANLGTLTALLTAQDAVFCERLNHASLVDGCRASDARMLVYRSDEPDELDARLGRRRADFETVFLVTDTVFSMDGTQAPLPELCRIAEKWDAVLIVDEAHATGVFGTHGRGICELQQVESRVAVRIGTLSKALGCLGGFVVGSSSLIEFLWNTARTQFFSTALPPAICAAATQALKLIDEEPHRRHTLASHSDLAFRLAAELGLHTPAGCTGPIIPILIGDEEQAIRLNEQLFEHGIFVPAIRPPTVPTGTSRLRLSLTAEHTEQQIRDTLTLIAATRGSLSSQ